MEKRNERSIQMIRYNLVVEIDKGKYDENGFPIHEEKSLELTAFSWDGVLSILNNLYGQDYYNILEHTERVIL